MAKSLSPSEEMIYPLDTWQKVRQKIILVLNMFVRASSLITKKMTRSIVSYTVEKQLTMLLVIFFVILVFFSCFFCLQKQLFLQFEDDLIVMGELDVQAGKAFSEFLNLTRTKKMVFESLILSKSSKRPDITFLCPGL